MRPQNWAQVVHGRHHSRNFRQCFAIQIHSLSRERNQARNAIYISAAILTWISLSLRLQSGMNWDSFWRSLTVETDGGPASVATSKSTVWAQLPWRPVSASATCSICSGWLVFYFTFVPSIRRWNAHAVSDTTFPEPLNLFLFGICCVWWLAISKS